MFSATASEILNTASVDGKRRPNIRKFQMVSFGSVVACLSCSEDVNQALIWVTAKHESGLGPRKDFIVNQDEVTRDELHDLN